MSLYWIITAWGIIFQVATSYLTLPDAITCFSFHKQPCWKRHLKVVEKMRVCYRRVKSLACINQRNHPRRLQNYSNWAKNSLTHYYKVEEYPLYPLSLRKKCGQRIKSWLTTNQHQRWIFFLPWRDRPIPKWECHDSSCSNCWKVGRGAWDIIFPHGLATTESRPGVPNSRPQRPVSFQF